MHPDAVRLLNRQHGLVTDEQLRGVGMSDDEIRWLRRRGVFHRIRPRVNQLAGAPVSWEQAVLAAALCAGASAVVSHTTAAALFNLRHSDRDRAGIHLTDQRQLRLAGVKSHEYMLPVAERTAHRGIPVTTPERTIIDLAGTLTDGQLAQCVDDAIRRNLASVERLRRIVARLAAPGAGRRRLQPVHKVLADRIPGYRPDDSDFETEMNRMWDRLRLPAAARQHRVVIDRHAYRLDRAIVEQKVAVEWDSHRYHSNPSDLDYDSNRRARLVGAGWLIIPVTTNSEPELIARAVLRAYQDRGGPGR